MAESSWAETITSFLKIRKSPFTALNHSFVSDVNYNDPSIILHRKRCDPPQISGKSEQPMAQKQVLVRHSGMELCLHRLFL